MKKAYISYANEKYRNSQLLLSQSAITVGKVDLVKAYNETWLKDQPFWKKNQYILSQPRGAGFWIWKPFLILNTFNELEDGDIVLYSDAGLLVINNLDPLFKAAQDLPNGGKVLFKLPAVGVTAHKAKTWTKRDCFVLMNADEQKYWDADMINGAISLWVKNKENIEFLNEWQKYLQDPRIVTDDFNMCGPNHMGFKDHRHDQSVLTILSVKNNFTLFCDPTQYGEGERHNFYNSPWGQLFNHHRGNIDFR